MKSFDQLQGIMSFISFASVIVSHRPFSRYRLPSSASITLLFVVVVHHQVPATSRRVSTRISNFIVPHYLRPLKARTEALAAYTTPMIYPETFDTMKNLANQYGATVPGKLVRFLRPL